MLKKILRRTALVLLSLVLLLALLFALFHAVENIRGKRAWEQYRRECAARDEDITDWQSLAPPPVPDADNIAKAPVFQDLLASPPRKKIQLPYLPRDTNTNTNTISGFVWQTGQYTGLDRWRAAFTNDDLLAALSVYDDDLREVEDALKRPSFRYEKWDEMNSVISSVKFVTCVPHIYALRAKARHEAGQYEDMLVDIQTGFCLANLCRTDPIVGSAFDRAMSFQMMCDPLWRGISGYVWNAHQLETLQGMLEPINMIEHIILAKRFECKQFTQMLTSLPKITCLKRMMPIVFPIIKPFERPRDLISYNYDYADMIEPAVNMWGYLIPKGWFYQNAVHYARFLDQNNSAIHTDERWISISQLKHTEGIFGKSRHNPYTTLPIVWEEYFFRTLNYFLSAQATVHQAVLACAIERYRLEHGRIPERLDALVPQFLAQIPCDPCDGQPMRYKPVGNGDYILYSIGWNETDDNGEPAWEEMRYGKRPDPDNGDWIWRSAGDDLSQKSEVRSQRSEVRSQKSEVRSQKSEVAPFGKGMAGIPAGGLQSSAPSRSSPPCVSASLRLWEKKILRDLCAFV
ncbi:MAG: hypothetical protein FWH21_05970 [Kiritimatiellaeota bacterium]|nr:hypothetical protein [Kiritimatiellota bacterium]